MSVALVSAATATATALTVGVEPPPAPAKRVATESVDLAAAIRLLPNHDQVHDITGGLGTTVYNFDQALLDQISRALVNGVSLTALARAAGVDPQSLVRTLLANVPANLLSSILNSITLNLPILDTVLDAVSPADSALLSKTLNLLGVQITDGTLTGLLALLGIDLSDPLNLANLNVPGLNVVTAGATFSLLKTLGVDLGWVPGLPNSVANDINGTPYLNLGVNGIVDLVQGLLNKAVANNTLDLGPLSSLLSGLGLPIGGTVQDAVNTLVASLAKITQIADPITGLLPDVLDARVIPTVGIGVGAFAAAMAYKQVLAQLASQPGGVDYTGTNPVLGSLTILPMILINNPGRPDGGAIARFGALASLLGIDSVNPTTSLTGSGGLLGDINPLGLHVGGANVLPILVDATYEYQPLSDLASWPDAFTLINNLAAGLSPTYMLRGLSLDGLDADLLKQIGAAVGNASTANPLALNIYLTLHSSTLPMLEPLYLTSDALNLVGIKPVADFAMHLANALAPALRTLVDIGYADAVQNPDGTVTRDTSTAGTETPFLSFPDINFQKALGTSFNQLMSGIQKEFFSANPTPGTPNVLKELINVVLGALGTKPPAATPPLTALSATTATSVPAANAKLLSVASVAPTKKVTDDAASSKTTDKTTDKTDETTDTAADGSSGDGAPAASDNGDAKPAKGSKHAKPDGDSSSTTAGDQTTGGKHGKHAKPDSDGTTTATGGTDTGVTTGPKHAKSGADADTAHDLSKGGKKKGGDTKGAAATGSDAGGSSGKAA